MTSWFYVTVHNCVMWALSIWTLFSHIHCHILVVAENTFLNAFTNLNNIICHCFCVDANVKIMKLLMGRLCTQIFILVIFYKLDKFSSPLFFTNLFSCSSFLVQGFCFFSALAQNLTKWVTLSDIEKECKWGLGDVLELRELVVEVFGFQIVSSVSLSFWNLHRFKPGDIR